jgi:Histidine kinase
MCLPVAIARRPLAELHWLGCDLRTEPRAGCERPARSAAPSPAEEQRGQAGHRVQSMPLMHERLYHVNDAARFDFESYLRTLMAYLFASYSTSDTAIALKLSVDTPAERGAPVPQVRLNRHRQPAGQLLDPRAGPRPSGPALRRGRTTGR